MRLRRATPPGWVRPPLGRPLLAPTAIELRVPRAHGRSRLRPSTHLPILPDSGFRRHLRSSEGPRPTGHDRRRLVRRCPVSRSSPQSVPDACPPTPDSRSSRPRFADGEVGRDDPGPGSSSHRRRLPTRRVPGARNGGPGDRSRPDDHPPGVPPRSDGIDRVFGPLRRTPGGEGQPGGRGPG